MSSPYYQAPAWIADGMTVWIRWDREKGTALRCKVACAAGYHARVVNEQYGVDRWFHIDNLLVPPDGPHTYDALPGIVARAQMHVVK